jgi:SHS2 domain-containing protein
MAVAGRTGRRLRMAAQARDDRSERTSPRYRFVEHVGEVAFDLEAGDEAGIFAAALLALATLVRNGGGKMECRVVELSGADRPLLLVDWLSELLFLAEVEEFVPVRTVELDLHRDGLRAVVLGRRTQPSPLVKGITLNELELAPTEGGWHGRVVLDV